MAVQKVVYGGTTLIDLTADTATAADVLQSKTFHKADGTIATGSIAKLAAQTFTPTTADQTIAAGKYLDGAQTIKGDANLVASNIASGVSIFGVVGTFAGGGGGSEFASLVMRTITTANDSSLTYVGKYAFASCVDLTTVNLANCVRVSSSGFADCTKLTTVSLPKCLSFESYVFSGCTSLTSISLPLAQSLGLNMFYDTKLVSLICPSVTSMAGVLFAGVTGSNNTLTTISFPLLKSLAIQAFISCKALVSISLPICEGIYASAFKACGELSEISLPSAQTIGAAAFAYCTALSTVSLNRASVLSSSAFQACYHLLSLYLMGTSVCKLSNKNVFSSTPISDYTASTGGVYGSIFVPASLYSAYISSTNWVTYSARFVSV